METMTWCRTYEEAKFQAIQILSDIDLNVNQVRIEYSKKDNAFLILYTEFDDNFYDNLGSEREELYNRIYEIQDKIDDLEMRIAEKKKEMGR